MKKIKKLYNIRQTDYDRPTEYMHEAFIEGNRKKINEIIDAVNELQREKGFSVPTEGVFEENTISFTKDNVEVDSKLVQKDLPNQDPNEFTLEELDMLGELVDVEITFEQSKIDRQILLDVLYKIKNLIKIKEEEK